MEYLALVLLIVLFCLAIPELREEVAIPSTYQGISTSWEDSNER